jgi:O-succinylbenzoate synthase
MRAFSYRLPFVKPFRTAAGTFSERRGILLCTDDGTSWADAAPLLPFSGHDTDQLIAQVAQKAEAGKFPEYRFAVSCLQTPPQNPQNPVRTNALLDLLAEDFLNRAEKLISEGYSTIKAKIGLQTEREITAIRAIARAFPDIKLRLDGNQSFSKVTLVPFAENLPIEQLDYLEQPCSLEEMKQLSIWRAASGIRVFADESATTLASLQMLAAQNIVDGIVLKPQLAGSLEEIKAMVLFARNQGWNITFTTLLESLVGRQLTARLAAIHAPHETHGLSTGALLQKDFGRDHIRDGWFYPATEIRLDPGKMEEIRL